MTTSAQNLDRAPEGLPVAKGRFIGQRRDMVKLMGFYDPDGNPWMLAETSKTYPGR